MSDSRWIHRILLISAMLAVIPVAGAAQNTKAAGYVNGTQKVVASVPLADGTVAKRIEFKMTVVTDDPANPIHLASQDCFATYVFSKDDKPIAGRGSCDGITADGHLWWIDIELGADGKVRWTNKGGVGKFSKLTGSGTTTVLADFPDGKTINRFEGTYSD